MTNVTDELLARVLSGQASPHEVKRVDAWRAESADHQRYFDETALIWQVTEPEQALDLPGPPAPSEIIARAETDRRRGAARRMRQRFRPTRAWSVGIAALLAAVSLGVWIGLQRSTDPGSEFVAGGTQPMTVALADGTVVRLAAGSTLRFAANDDRREAWLTGRAFFGVRHDEARPFVVHTDLGETRVLGTRFEVRHSDQELRVVVVEGRVAVSGSSGRSTNVNPGQVARLNSNGDFSLTTEDVQALLDWEQGLLVFQATPLRTVAEEIDRHFGVDVALQGDLADRRITAWFDDEPLEEVVSSICLVVGISCTVDGDSVFVGDSR